MELFLVLTRKPPPFSGFGGVGVWRRRQPLGAELKQEGPGIGRAQSLTFSPEGREQG